MVIIKKRIIAAVMAAIMICLSLTGCHRKQPEPAPVDNTVRITFREGSTVLDIAKKLEDNNVCSADEFIEACKTIPEGYDRLFTGVSKADKVFVLEGYLFPDTYEFYYGENVPSVISRFLKQTNAKITDDDLARTNQLGMTLDEVITFASVVQAEASITAEAPKVASVFWNRLNSSDFPYIGSDVTRHYIERTCKTYIEENGLDYNMLFGSYCTNDGYSLKTRGLPSGAICNPGYECISAVLHPASTDYLYFFTDPDGGFHYNHTYSAHQSEYNKLTYGK